MRIWCCLPNYVCHTSPVSLLTPASKSYIHTQQTSQDERGPSLQLATFSMHSRRKKDTKTYWPSLVEQVNLSIRIPGVAAATPVHALLSHNYPCSFISFFTFPISRNTGKKLGQVGRVRFAITHEDPVVGKIVYFASKAKSGKPYLPSSLPTIESTLRNACNCQFTPGKFKTQGGRRKRT